MVPASGFSGNAGWRGRAGPTAVLSSQARKQATRDLPDEEFLRGEKELASFVRIACPELKARP